MAIKAIRMFDGGFIAQLFAFGGEEGKEAFDDQICYRNSLQNEDHFYMMHGDVTYCDAALKANKLSIIFEDKAAARDTLDRVRAFIKTRPTVYLSTHCPEGYESLELKRAMKLA